MERLALGRVDAFLKMYDTSHAIGVIHKHLVRVRTNRWFSDVRLASHLAIPTSDQR